jgi:hypothetical protein
MKKNSSLSEFLWIYSIGFIFLKVVNLLTGNEEKSIYWVLIIFSISLFTVTIKNKTLKKNIRKEVNKEIIIITLTLVILFHLIT